MTRDLNKWDLVKPARGAKNEMKRLVEETRANLFFLDYAPVLIASVVTGENVLQLFELITEIKRLPVRDRNWRLNCMLARPSMKTRRPPSARAA